MWLTHCRRVLWSMKVCRLTKPLTSLIYSQLLIFLIHYILISTIYNLIILFILVKVWSLQYYISMMTPTWFRRLSTVLTLTIYLISCWMKSLLNCGRVMYELWFISGIGVSVRLCVAHIIIILRTYFFFDLKTFYINFFLGSIDISYMVFDFYGLTVLLI